MKKLYLPIAILTLCSLLSVESNARNLDISQGSSYDAIASKQQNVSAKGVCLKDEPSGEAKDKWHNQSLHCS